MSKQCDIVRDILPLYVDGACSEASAEMVKEHLNACADCNAIYQKLLSHTNEDVLHEESESVIMRHEAKEKQRGKKKITIAVLVSIALCIIAIFAALFLLPINIQIAFFEKLGMQKIADHCVRIMEDYRKGIGKQKESDCR